MQNQRSSAIRSAYVVICAFMLLLSGVAYARPLQGRFANGPGFSGEYTISDGRDEDGLPVHVVKIIVRAIGEKVPLQYEYAADDFPLVEVNPAGYILILVHSGGMEGQVDYNYVAPHAKQLVSIGIVRMQLHLGKVESIEVQPNKSLADAQVDDLIKDGLRFNSPDFFDSRNAYRAAAFLLLGRRDFLRVDDKANLKSLLNNKEISDDPVLLAKLEGLAKGDDDLGGVPSALTYRVIGVDRAYFLNSPSSMDVMKSYLIKGDRVSLVRRSADRRYWLVDYVSKVGRKTEKWLSCEAIDYCD